MNSDQSPCSRCEKENKLNFSFTMAFQPIINCKTQSIFGYEALVRGLNNESAHSILSQVNDDNRYQFDQQCRTKAIALAAKLGITSLLSINFLPNAIHNPKHCISKTLAAAKQYDFPIERIIFEFTEVEKFSDSSHIKRIVECYQSLGFSTATDDFGSGYSGLNLMADFQTDIVKLDMGLIRNIHCDDIRQCIVKHCLRLFSEINIIPLAEGIETREEFIWLREAGVELMQGYFFARPGFEHLPTVNFNEH